MLNLHNILLISPPQNHPPPSISSDHQNNIHHQEYSSNNNENNNNNNHNSSRNLHESSNFWSLKKFQESKKKHVQEDKTYTGACRDCGNRAKKECSFRRCRTCCKTRGYDCATHMRSTWVPAAKRREKKLMTMVSGGSCGGGGGGRSSGSSCGVKRPRGFWSPSAQHVNTSAPSPSTPMNASASTSLSIKTGPCYQEESFKRSLPGQVQAPAEFRCIRVTSVSDDDAEIGYVATVNISGHVFKGYLYDHGIDDKKLFPCVSKMQMENDVSTARNRDPSSSPVGDQSAYAASVN